MKLLIYLVELLSSLFFFIITVFGLISRFIFALYLLSITTMTLPPTLSFFPMCSIFMSPSATPFLHCSVFSPLLLLLHSSFCLLLLSLSLNYSLSFRFLPSSSSLPLFLSLSPSLLFFALLLFNSFLLSSPYL